MHWIEKRSTVIKSGVTCSTKVTNYGQTGIYRLGGETRNVFVFAFFDAFG
jgi:hypothetical protein